MKESLPFGRVFRLPLAVSFRTLVLSLVPMLRFVMLLGAGQGSPFYLKFLAGAITGGVGSFVGNPFDVMKTLAQTNKGSPVPLSSLVSQMYKDQGLGKY